MFPVTIRLWIKWKTLKMLASQKVRFIIVGGFNTLISILIFYINDLLFSERWHYLVILFISHIMSVTISYVNFRLFVFKPTNSFIKGYTNAHLVYAATFLINAFLLWYFVDQHGTHVVLTQAILVAFIAIISFYGHKLFTFKESSKNEE